MPSKQKALFAFVAERLRYDYDSVERTFWKNVRFNPPTYGADMSGSFMDSSVTAWNCNNLNCILQVLGADLPGNTSGKPELFFF